MKQLTTAGSPQRLAKLGDPHSQDGCVRSRFRTPQLIEQAAAGYHIIGVHQQHGQQHPLPESLDRHQAAIGPDLKGAQDQKLQHRRPE
jgi:hypothetical protein